MPRRSAGRAPRPAARSPPKQQSSGYSTQQAPRPATPPPPAPHHAPAPPAHAPSGGGSMLGGMAGMVAQGMALGTGSALAHRAIDSVFSSGSSPEPAQAEAAAQQIVKEDQPCSNQAKLFSDCMGFQNGDMMACQQYFDAMQQCRLNLNYQ